jgi:hypothetical protein
MRTISTRRWALVLLGLFLPTASTLRGEQDQAGHVEFFEKKVRPILVGHCYTCHSADTRPAGGLRVDDRNGLLSGGNTGPAVVPGDPARSLLVQRVTHKDPKKRMPQEGQPLNDKQVADLTQWIQDGAAWPVVRLPASFGKAKPFYDKLKREHWAWQPLTDPKVPAVKDAAWPKDDIDRFLLARLESKNLKPAGDADKVALLRRLTFDLTGLPPSPKEMAEFEHSTVEKCVDHLLASPAFGERWGRHWLDVARYGESTGPSRNIPYPHAWKYRDYVIDAVNADVPFNRFLQEQVAGDLLPAANAAERDRLLIATGFLALGVKDVNQRFKVRFAMDNVDEQIDAVARSVLALTVSCARCHDHKFDPIPTTDYYALAGIFTSTDNCAGVRNKMGGGGLDYYDPSMVMTMSADLPAVSAELVEKRKAELAEAKKAWDAIRDTPEGLAKGPDGMPRQRPYRLKYEKAQDELLSLTDPVARGLAVHGVRDARQGGAIGDTALRIRGEAEKLGPTVARGFLTVFEVPGSPTINPKQSGRLELGQWLTNPQNPLTARVIVNRVWQHLFDQGLVTTVDNFGVTGDTPSHPELLDHLATRFMRDGWSIKKLVRTLVLTRAYQLSAEASPAQLAADPANRLVWRHTPRRLNAEELRDAMLAAAGNLDLKRPSGSPVRQFKMIEMRDDGPEAKRIHEQADNSRHRSVYLPLLRGVTPHTIEAFDPVEQGLVTGQRSVTTVPAQALYLLNSSFVHRQSLDLAERVLRDKEGTDTDRIRTVYRLALSRAPTDRESQRARSFLAEFETGYRKDIASRPANPGKAARDPAQAKDARMAAWQALGQALFACAEFRYLN